MDKRKESSNSSQDSASKGLSKKAWEQLYKFHNTPTKMTYDEFDGPKEKDSEIVVSEKKITAEWADPDAENKKTIHTRSVKQEKNTFSIIKTITDTLTVIHEEEKYTFEHESSIDTSRIDGGVAGRQHAKFINNSSGEIEILHDEASLIDKNHPPSQPYSTFFGDSDTSNNKSYDSTNAYGAYDFSKEQFYNKSKTRTSQTAFEASKASFSNMPNDNSYNYSFPQNDNSKTPNFPNVDDYFTDFYNKPNDDSPYSFSPRNNPSFPSFPNTDYAPTNTEVPKTSQQQAKTEGSFNINVSSDQKTEKLTIEEAVDILNILKNDRERQDSSNNIDPIDIIDKALKSISVYSTTFSIDTTDAQNLYQNLQSLRAYATPGTSAPFNNVKIANDTDAKNVIIKIKDLLDDVTKRTARKAILHLYDVFKKTRQEPSSSNFKEFESSDTFSNKRTTSQENTEQILKKKQKKGQSTGGRPFKTEFPSFQEKRTKEQPAELLEQDLSSDIKEKLDKIKSLNTFYLDKSRNTMASYKNRQHSGDRTTNEQSAYLAKHFANVKKLNSKLTMPNANIREIYATKVAIEGMESYSILEERYRSGDLTDIIKGYYRQSEFDFAQQ